MLEYWDTNEKLMALGVPILKLFRVSLIELPPGQNSTQLVDFV